MEWLEQRGIAYGIRDTGTPGILEIFDPVSGNPIKTVYDPVAFTDQQMIALARDAGEIVWNSLQAQGSLAPGTFRDVIVGGIEFRVYINPESGTGRPVVGNVHPI
jgi:hypothetical protein